MTIRAQVVKALHGYDGVLLMSGAGCPRPWWPRALVLLGLVCALAGGASLALHIPAAAQATEQEEQQSLLLVLDSSGSMKDPAGGGSTRFQAATRALNQVIGELPADLDVGLRVYGARIADGPGSCKDSELVVPVGPLDRQGLRRAVADAEPKGNTPIAHSLRQAAQDLPDQGQRTIVLVSDGEESCGGDPCAVARDLSAQGLDVRVDVIGFQVTGAARDQLTCIAQAGRGTYYDAPDAEALSQQLERLSARAARDYRPAGIPVEGTPTADGAPVLEPGDYLDTIGDGGNVETYRASVPEGGTLHASATIRPTTPALLDTEALKLEVTGPNGLCDSQIRSAVGGADLLTPVTAGVIVTPPEQELCGPPPYDITVERGRGSGVKPLEVSVVEEPRVTDRAQLPAAAAPGSFDAKADVSGPTRTAVGAPSFSAAPVLEPGRYRDSTIPGETLIYAAEVDWGQQLVCDVTFRRSRTVDRVLGLNQPPMTVRAYGPGHARMSDTLQAQALFYGGAETVTGHVFGPPVRYLNREGDDFQAAASIPGTYYCAAYLNAEPGTFDVEVPVTVTLDVVGEATDGPAYAQTAADPTTTAPPQPGNDDTSADGDASGGADAADADGTGVLPWGLGLLAVLLAVGLALLAYRRRSAA